MEAMSDKIRRLIKKANSREYGFSLIEVIVAVAILGLIAVGIYSAMGASVRSSVNEEEQGTARNLAEAQLEYAKHLKLFHGGIDEFEKPEGILPIYYPPDDTILSEYPGYEVTIDVETYDEETRDAFEQLITVTVFLDEEKVLTLQGIKLLTDTTFPEEGLVWDWVSEGWVEADPS